MTITSPADFRYDDPRGLAAVVAALPAPLLLCTDIDGTLSTIAARPAEARLLAGAADALRALSRAGLDVAVVSGRSMAELVRQFELPRTLHLVGSHGVELEQSTPRTEHEGELLDRVDAILADIVARHPGSALERKPFGSALHVRQCTAADADDALRAAHAAIDGIEGVLALPGHGVYEVVVRETTKVHALDELRARLDPASVVFVGDDHSDELVFASFVPGGSHAQAVPTIGVKVGVEPSVAAHRLRSPDDVLTFIHALVELVAD
jgi:trehalose 6-phosphate phosphatase